MSRTTSATFRQAVFSQETDKVFLPIITISHPSLGSPLRFVRDAYQITSGGNVYLPFPFNVTLPNDRDDGGQVKSVQLTIDNVDRSIIGTLRSIPDSPTLTLSIVLASSPDTVEFGPMTFSLQGVSYNADTITGTLVAEDRLQNKVPGLTWNPVDFSGVFA